MCISYYFDRYYTSENVKFVYNSTFSICRGSIFLRVQTPIAGHVPTWLVERYVQEAAVHHLLYSGSYITHMLPTYHTILNVIKLYFA
jgi:hypothetical protein